MIGNMFLVIPMTTQGKENKRYYYQLQSFGDLKSRIIISQIKMIDKKRFLEKIGHISAEEYLTLKKALRDRYFPVPSS
jgi:mRNA-degrading endonuclease toxin of MazEF toxin-antitoxin module